MPAHSQERLLTVQQAADILGLAPSTLNKWRLCGGGPEFVKLGRRITYRRKPSKNLFYGRPTPIHPLTLERTDAKAFGLPP